jgi:hypothetical protein
MSASPPKADIAEGGCHVRLVLPAQPVVIDAFSEPPALLPDPEEFRRATLWQSTLRYTLR